MSFRVSLSLFLILVVAILRVQAQLLKGDFELKNVGYPTQALTVIPSGNPVGWLSDDPQFPQSSRTWTVLRSPPDESGNTWYYIQHLGSQKFLSVSPAYKLILEDKPFNWVIVDVDSGCYRIHYPPSRSADVELKGGENGAAIQLGDFKRLPPQLWNFNKVGN
ncbi:hypothetical protein BGW38_002296 [Lunasporangiospora selenospora]|uniref:Ricin B lectin domain-containing protein n=1 Tax=Lunasporangiospora selenospora TaxID=979761 RepID=A0A9P6FUC3_9FUNG|nr:hypothetical protein BGW38_002296 [Lunasporangiospora selenospora]